MKHRILAIPILLVVAMSGLTHAQYTVDPIPMGTTTGWNLLGVDRIISSNPPGYVSIIGAPSAQHLLPTGSSDFVDYILPFPLFVGGERVSGSIIRISMSGYVSFNGMPSPTSPAVGSRPYNLIKTNQPITAPWQSKLVMPYWGDFVSANPPDGGIWVDTGGVGPVPDPNGHPGMRELTIEWFVKTLGPTVTTGKFQAKFFEYVTVSYGQYKIEFHYDPGSNLTLPTPDSTGNYGAVVGLKNWGQPKVAWAPDNLDLGMMIILHPDRDFKHIPSMGSPLALVQLGYFTFAQNSIRPPLPMSPPGPSIQQSGDYPEWFANYFLFEPNMASYILQETSPFHFGFPPVVSGQRTSYRMRPVSSTATPSTWPDESGFAASGVLDSAGLIFLPEPVSCSPKPK